MPQPGEVMGRYQLVNVVGEGGMATVLLARQVGPQGFVKPCVLKIIADKYHQDPSVRRMFLEEARVSALLNHPHIVQTFDFGEASGTPYMAMELVDGVNLAKLLRTLAKNDRWIPLSTSVEICEAVLSALDYAHSLNDLDGKPLHLIHRDVSPQNVLLSRQGGVKLADFGIARHDARDEETVGLEAKGKPGYMSPEQAMCQTVDGRSDLFALGIILVELISARRVHLPDEPVVGMRGLEKRIQALCNLRRDLPVALKNFALEMTAVEPSDRPSSANEALRKLRAAQVPGSESTVLRAFLPKIFSKFFPAAVVGESSAPSSTSLPPVDAHATKSPVPAPSVLEADTIQETNVDAQPPALSGLEDATVPPDVIMGRRASLDADPGAIPAPPQSDTSDEPFEEKSWVDQEAPTGTGIVYDGWPSKFLGTSVALKLPETAPNASAPTIEVVQHSSSVDAMDHFRPQVSEEAARRGHDPSVDKPDASKLLPLGRPDSELGLSSIPAAIDHGATPGSHRVPYGSPALLRHKGAATGGVLDQLVEPTPPPAPEKKASEPKSSLLPKIKAVVPLLLGGILFVGVGLAILVAVGNRSNDRDPGAMLTGTVSVTSEPPGARIFVGDVKTPHTTPHILEDIPIDTPIELRVKLDGFIPVPHQVKIQLATANEHTSAAFQLKRGRTFRIETTPPNASVTLNQRQIPGVTPVDLPAIPLGTSATIGVTLEGFLPTQLVIVANADTATVSTVALEEGREIDIISEPPGAKVFVDKLLRGNTPLYDVLVPQNGRFLVELKHPGFRTWSKKVRGNQFTDQQRQIEADLQPVPLLAMPMSNDERKRARAMDKKLHRLEASIRKTKQLVARTEEKRDRLEQTGRAHIGDLADAQKAADVAANRLAELESARQDLLSNIETFRDQVLQRVASGSSGR